jgi:hypothetical protein
MKKHLIKPISYIIITLFSLPTLAEKVINITVKTSDTSAIAIGYSVVGKSTGTVGKSYSGTGPKDKKYSFGYRRQIHGSNIICGDLTLTKDSVITLVTKNNKCTSIISQR